MKKISLIITGLLIAGNVMFAQKFKAIMGDENDNQGRVCVLIMKNGNSVYYDETFIKKNYLISIYDGNLKQLVKKEMKFQSKDLTNLNFKKDESYDINKVFEINGKIVIFSTVIKTEESKRTSLYRIIVNPTTAEVESDELLFTIDKTGNDMDAFFGVDKPEYFVNKDENSDFYAIIKYRYQKRDDAAGNYEVHHYSPDHKEISNARFDYVNNNYEYARPLNLVVFSDKYVIIASFAFNSEKKINKDTKVIFSKLEKGKKEFTHEQLDYSENFSTQKCELKRNEKNNNIEALLFLENRDFQNQIKDYTLIFQGIKPDKMELNNPFFLPQKMVNEYSIKNYDSKEGFVKSIFVCFRIEPNGNILSLTRNTTFLGVTEMDVNGKEINVWVYPHINNEYFIPFCTSKGNFVITQEMEENMNKPLNEKFEKVDYPKSNPIVLTLKGNGEVSREYLFGAPQNDKNVIMDQYSKFVFYDEKSKISFVSFSIGKHSKKENFALIKFE